MLWPYKLADVYHTPHTTDHRPFIEKEGMPFHNEELAPFAVVTQYRQCRMANVALVFSYLLMFDVALVQILSLDYR